MKLILESENVFHYLTNLPAFSNEDGEKWKDKADNFRPVVTVSLGKAELPSPLRIVDIQFRSTDKFYSALASIVGGEPIALNSLSRKLEERFSGVSGYKWGPIQETGIRGYVYEGDSTTPSFAVDYGLINGKRNSPIFLIYTGHHGAKQRTLESEDSFIQEVTSFQNVVSNFIDSCLSVRRKQGYSPKRRIVVPSCLEMSFSGVRYGC